MRRQRKNLAYDIKHIYDPPLSQQGHHECYPLYYSDLYARYKRYCTFLTENINKNACFLFVLAKRDFQASKPAIWPEILQMTHTYTYNITYVVIFSVQRKHIYTDSHSRCRDGPRMVNKSRFAHVTSYGFCGCAGAVEQVTAISQLNYTSLFYLLTRTRATLTGSF